MRILRVIACAKSYRDLRTTPNWISYEFSFGAQFERLNPAVGDIIHIRELDSSSQRTGSELPRRITSVREGFVTLSTVQGADVDKFRAQLYLPRTQDFEAIEITDQSRATARTIIQAEIDRLRKNRSDCLIPPLVKLQTALGDVALTARTESFLRWFLTSDFEAHEGLAFLIEAIRQHDNKEIGGAAAARRLFAETAVPA